MIFALLNFVERYFEEISQLVLPRIFSTPWNVQIAMLDGLASVFQGIRSSKGAEALLAVDETKVQLEMMFTCLSEAKYPAVRAASLKCVKDLVYAIRETSLWIPEIRAQVEAGIAPSLNDTVGETADYANQVKILL